MNRKVPNPIARFRAKQTEPLVVSPAAAYAGAAAGVHESAGSRPRSKRFWLVLGLVALVALLMSNCAGRVAGDSAFESQQRELSAALLAQDGAESRVDELEREVRELTPQIGESEAVLASLEAERETVASLQQERDAALAAVAELESRVAELEADVAAAAADQAPPTQPQPAAQPAPAARPAPVAQPAPAASAYYENCAAARAAGAAPLRQGSPGYRSGLDRDGDGVACES